MEPEILLPLSVQSAILPIVGQMKPVHALPAWFCSLRQVHKMNVCLMEGEYSSVYLSVCPSKPWCLLFCSVLQFVLILLHCDSTGYFGAVSEVPSITNLNDKWLLDCLTLWTHFIQLSPDPYAAVKADPHFLMNSL